MFKLTGVQPVYLMHSLNSFAGSLVGIFIPIYLLLKGFTVSEVLIFFIEYYVAVAVFSFVALYLGKRIGLQYTVLISFVSNVSFLLLLNTLAAPLLVIAIAGGIAIALYWMPLHLFFSRNVSDRSAGKETGKLFAWPKFASMFAPALGGFIASLFGFDTLFTVAIIALLFSAFPMFGYSTVRAQFQFSLRSAQRLLASRRRFFIAEIFENIGEETGSIIWPVFVFLTLASIESIGYIGTLVSAGTILFTLLIGTLSDRKNKLRLSAYGGVFLAAVWWLHTAAVAPLVIMVVSAFRGFAEQALLVPYTSVLYSIMKKDEADEFVVFREIPVAIGRVAILSLGLLFVHNLRILFAVAGLCYLYFLIFLRDTSPEAS